MRDELRRERLRRASTEDALTREQAARVRAVEHCAVEVAKHKRLAARAEADYVRMRAERDQLEWLLRRVRDPSAPQTLEVCHVCGKSVGLK